MINIRGVLKKAEFRLAGAAGGKGNSQQGAQFFLRRPRFSQKYEEIMGRKIRGVERIPAKLMEEFTKHKTYNKRLNSLFSDFYRQSQNFSHDQERLKKELVSFMFELNKDELCEYLMVAKWSQLISLRTLYSSHLREILLVCGSYDKKGEIKVNYKVRSFLYKYGRIDGKLSIDFVNRVIEQSGTNLGVATSLDLAFVSAVNRVVIKELWERFIPELLSEANEVFYHSSENKAMMLGKVLLFIKLILLPRHNVRSFVSEQRVEQLLKLTQLTFIEKYSATASRVRRSKTQILIEEALRALQIPFIGEHNIDFFDVDIYLPVSETVIELYSMFHFYPYSRSFKAEATYFKEIIFKEMGKKYLYLSEVPEEPRQLQSYLLEKISSL